MKSSLALAVAVLALAVCSSHCQELVKVGDVNGPEKTVFFSQASEILQILVVVDTDRLTDAFQDKTPSKDPDHPTPINHTFAFMITNVKHVEEGQATADLHIKCIPGDLINWYGVSESNNFDNQIIVYGIKHNSKTISPVMMDVRTKEHVYAKNNNIKDIEAVKLGTLMIYVTVREAGEVNYDVNFAVYKTLRATGKRELVGYFTWDPKITIKG